jgi:hypothetical protein
MPASSSVKRGDLEFRATARLHIQKIALGRLYRWPTLTIGRILEGQHALVGLAWKSCGPLVAFKFRVGAVELVRNPIEIVREEPGVDVQGHGRPGVAEHLLRL